MDINLKSNQARSIFLLEKVEKAQIREYLTHANSAKEKMVNSSRISN
ncbi:MAG: hypothetical protein ACW99A_00300 [Candidatus Kariarchaeaceae archaeon]|jgi:hypothetical protein